MARLATRPVRGLVALTAFVAAFHFISPTFSMLHQFANLYLVGGSMPRRSTVSRTTAHVSAVQVPTSGSEEMHTIFRKLSKAQGRWQNRAWLSSPTQQELDEYDAKLSAEIQMLEDLIQNSLEVETTTQLEWLETVLEKVGQLKEQLARQRTAEASAKMPMLVALGVLALFLAGSAYGTIANW